MDQAQALRRMAARKTRRTLPPAGPLRTMAVTSGKGGVGKTNVVVNLALALSNLGRKVLIIDADLGLANVDVVLGLNPRYTIADVIHGDRTLAQVLLKGPRDIKILPAASGVAELSHLSQEEKMLLLQELDVFPTDADVVLIDTAAGISDTVLYFNLAAQDRLVVATDEPTSLTDAYALMKVLYQGHGEKYFRLLVNNVSDEAQAKGVFRKLTAAADHFLGGLALDYLGFIPRDPAVSKAVIAQKPLLTAFPNSAAAKGFANLARNWITSPARAEKGNIKFFWRRLVSMA